MFPQIKPAHRRAEQSGTAHWRAPVIPTSFPAATTAAPGPGTRHGAAAPRPRGGGQEPPAATFSRAPIRVPRHARGGAPPITTGVPGGAAAASSPVTRPAAWQRLWRHCYECAVSSTGSTKGPKCPARRRQLRERRVCHGLPGTTDAGNAIVTERADMARSHSRRVRAHNA